MTQASALTEGTKMAKKVDPEAPIKTKVGPNVPRPSYERAITDREMDRILDSDGSNPERDSNLGGRR